MDADNDFGSSQSDTSELTDGRADPNEASEDMPERSTQQTYRPRKKPRLQSGFVHAGEGPSATSSSKGSDKWTQTRKKKNKKSKEKSRTKDAAPAIVQFALQPQDVPSGKDSVMPTGRRSGKAKPQHKRKHIGDDEDDEPLEALPFHVGLPPDSLPWNAKLDDLVRDKDTLSTDARLDVEIGLFYDYVKPRDFEIFERQQIIARVESFMKAQAHTSGLRVIAFGSFANGLFLPDSDMDLVVRSTTYEMFNTAVIGDSNSKLRKIARALEHYPGLAQSGSVQAIVHAKVPIIKFIDRMTGLQVDVCFENSNGLEAIETCKKWAQEEPALAPLVCLVKVLLAGLGDNEVHTGGIGGFSIVCLVYFYLVSEAHERGPEWDSTADPGHVFLRFLKYYSQVFKPLVDCVCVDPVQAIAKTRYQLLPDKGRLCIIDPHKPNNDLTAGSLNSMNIFAKLYKARESLLQRMDALDRDPHRFACVLDSVYGHFNLKFEGSRARLLHSAKQHGFVPAVPDPVHTQ